MVEKPQLESLCLSAMTHTLLVSAFPSVQGRPLAPPCTPRHAGSGRLGTLHAEACRVGHDYATLAEKLQVEGLCLSR